MKSTLLQNNFALEIDSVNEVDAATISEWLYRYKVLVIKNVGFTYKDYYDFISSLGQPIRHVLQEFALPDYPDIIKISNFVDHQGQPEGVTDGGAYWHSDMSYKPITGIATALYSVRTQRQGGETHFIDLVDGLDELKCNTRLTDKITTLCQCDLDDVVITHIFGNRRKQTNPEASEQKLTSQQKADMQPVLHKMIQTHPCTGQKSLFAISGTAMFIPGVSAQDSLEILNELEDFIIENAQCYRHVYNPHDLVLWDNMSTLHRGYNIQPRYVKDDSRLLHRMNVMYHRKR
ncbi:TauD/TfdA family dioxygenase [Prodigiosinella confusarubida]|uniref:TauD/TfdA family dioxygenase n=1 Tax=Serratia sp. (strain ATCC 39006) TaxID=104623 RepID=A0A2I5T8Y8_SERS3|nr:TauD/TfdA family dioxygenase [Serratia sp. ATCC 39006]AUH01031.1 TauD/TfdA family dioxygenase [Serratia sp. ATCC 39006]AUH05352.1 TauD/TfdA family dioxygenase [Serratia sp. ATCC 39006]